MGVPAPMLWAAIISGIALPIITILLLVLRAGRFAGEIEAKIKSEGQTTQGRLDTMIATIEGRMTLLDGKIQGIAETTRLRYEDLSRSMGEIRSEFMRASLANTMHEENVRRFNDVSTRLRTLESRRQDDDP